MLVELHKDITTVTEGIVLHGCNCSGGFGSGVAKAIKEKWPKVEKVFRCTKNPKLGDLYAVQITDKLVVCNAYTQQRYGYDGARYADLSAIRVAVTDVIKYAKTKNIKNIYMPKIGCGLGGLDWSTEVLPMLDTLNTDRLTINVCTI